MSPQDEAEQAAVAQWCLTLLAQHGAEWRAKGDESANSGSASEQVAAAAKAVGL